MNWTLYPISRFADFTKQWDDLNQRSTQAPTLNSDFVQPAVNHFATGQEKLALYGNPEQPSAAAILKKDKFGTWSTFQPSQNPLGAWLSETTLDESAIATALMKKLPGLCLVLGITQQDPDLNPRPKCSKNLDTIDYIETAKVPLNSSFDDYWSKRGKNLRQNLRRQGNRLEREETKATLKCITDAEQVRDAIKAYGELESAGWKTQTGTAISEDNNQGRFYIEMLENFCRKEQGRIYQYWYDNALVATDLCITGSGTIIILKTTYDETIKTSSPAMLMRKAAFEQLFAEPGMDKVEFYGKVMDWHTKWSEDIRTMYHTNLYRYSLLNRN